MEKLIANVSYELTEEMLENLLITAFEGGSNYWAMLGEIDKTDFDPKLDWYKNLVKLLFTKPGFKIDIYDCEDEEEIIGELSYKSIRMYLPILPNYLNQLLNLRNEEFDAEDCDVLFQVLTMGDVVFG